MAYSHDCAYFYTEGGYLWLKKVTWYHIAGICFFKRSENILIRARVRVNMDIGEEQLFFHIMGRAISAMD